jgi:hypothetical protein
MKLFEIVDRGDLHMQDIAARNSAVQQSKMAPSKGFWLVDRASGKKLAGPFADDDKAVSFKQNRKDKIPADARIVHM